MTGIAGAALASPPGLSNSNASAVATIQAVAASSFVSSIGVNAHIDSGFGAWENTALVQTEMSYLGISNIRDGTPYNWALSEYVALAKMGIKFDLTQENPVAAPMTTADAAYDVARADTLQLAVPGSVVSLEGANEYNISSYNLNGVNSYGNISWGALDDSQLQGAVAADATLKGVSVIAASTSGVTSLPNIGQYVSASNWHVYGGVGQQLAASMQAGIAAAQASAPGKPVTITEAGISSSGYGSSSWGVADQYTQGIIDTNAVLDGFADGASKTFLYDLMDTTQFSSAQENSFGLFNMDGTPKPAATDISNLAKILHDGGTGPFQPGTLAYGISGLPSGASSMLLAKSDGTYDIVVWNGNATLYNGSTDVTPPAANVAVTFGGNVQQLSVFDPVQGTSALQTSSNVSSAAFNLSADPIVVQVSPPSVVEPPPADVLDLHVSEDAWLGNAEYTVFMDGVEIGGIRTADTAHSSGGYQDVQISGNWSAGAHSATIHFINDAWGGTSATDRNLYVNAISYDGQAASPSTAALYRNGSVTFALGAAASAPGTVTLVLAEDAYLGNAQYTVAVDGGMAGSVGTVTALNALGQSQLADTIANLSPGVHDIAVSFLNDAWGGSAALDRNLYVKGVEVNGAVVPGTSYELYKNGTHDFFVTVPASGG